MERKPIFFSPGFLHIILFFSLRAINADDMLDSTILKSILPPINTKCSSNSNEFSGQTSSYTFNHSISPSFWDSIADPYEPDLFLAEMSNNNTDNQNKSWTVRFGQAGNIYSFRGAYGEAMPPQYHVEGQFIDEVTQSVSVNLEKNNNPDPYFIHQAGIYMKDGEYTENPFFSPNIAKYCSNKECMFGSWGQQAHVPTFHQSDLLYFNGYRDCGDGIIEFTSVFHNANSDLENGDFVNYLNAPWSGVRYTTLRDMFLSQPSGEMEVKYPMEQWGDEGLIDLKDTGGYTTFAEQVVIPEDVFNAYPFQMPEQDGITLQIVIAENNQARKSNGHSDSWNLYCMRVPVIATFTETLGCQSKCNLWLQNSRTGDRVNSPLVLHWSWNGNTMYFCTDGGVQAADFNAMFAAGDEVIVSYANTGKPIEDNLALTFIHGLQNDYDQRYANNRVRYGNAGSVRRDYTAYTTNSFVTINPGDTYVYRQFLATGELSEMESLGATYKGETYEDLFSLGEMTGSDIHLYSNDATLFGAFVEGDEACLQGITRCSGKSVPQLGLNALFAITCGDEAYVGSNRYHFAPPRASETETIRSYTCAGYSANVRPVWKLLGFFEEGSCDFLQNASYDSSFCSTSVSPTPNPSHYSSEIPTIVPTLDSSSVPTFSSTPNPSPHPTLDPSSVPSMMPTFLPSSRPTLNPSFIPSMNPTEHSGTQSPTSETYPASLELITDDFASETGWTLRNIYGTVDSVAPGDYSDFSTYSYDWDLVPACYLFTITDTFGDGMCCGHGTGSYNLTYNGEPIVSGGGDFGSSETSYFGDEGKEFSAFYQGELYTRSCDWISSQSQFSISAICTYENGDAGHQCPCVCFIYV